MQAYYKERGNVGRNVPNVSVLFTQPSAGDRRVPYTRPLNTPLYRERLSRLCQNRTVIPAAPQRTQRQSSPHESTGGGEHCDVTSQGVVLSTLPRPDVRAARRFIADVDFPVDLEESFNSGSLISTLNTSATHSLPPALASSLSPSLSLQNHHLQSHATTSKLGEKAKEVVPAQPSSHQQMLASHNSVPVVPDRDEFLLDSVVDSWNGSDYTASSLS